MTDSVALEPVPGAHIIKCADCDTELMARPGDAIAHDFTDGTHVFYPAGTTDDEEAK